LVEARRAGRLLPQRPYREPVKSAGKRPRLTNWAACPVTDSEIRRWGHDLASDTNTGLRCGLLIGVDIDVLDTELARSVEDLALAVLGPTPLRRVGRAPKLLLAYRSTEIQGKAETAEFWLPDQTKIQVEVLGKGQQFVSHGTHPDTGQPYVWTVQAPEDLSLASVPVVQPGRIGAFLLASEALFRDAGRRTAREIEAAHSSVQAPERHVSGASLGGGFFREVNDRAFADLDLWVRRIFPTARWQTNAAQPPGMWRVASADLGRGFEEDISIHVREGIQDFGTRESLTPIDLVIRHGGASNASAAALWLCEQLSIDPATLGWRGRRGGESRPEMGPTQGVRAPGAEPQQPQVSLWQDLAAWNPRDIPERPWVVPGYLMRGSVTVLSGQGAGGKSSLVVAWTIALATGGRLGAFAPVGPTVVVNYNTEDDRDEQQRRYSAALIAAGFDGTEVMPRIVRCGPNEVGTLFERNPNTGRVVETEAMQELERICEEAGAGLLVCDPLAELHNAEENDNTAMRAVIAAFRGLAKRLRIAVLILHHDRKGSSTPGDMDRVRGASAISGAVRVMLTLTTMSMEEADKLGVQAQERRRHFRLDGAKSNYAPTTEAEWWQLAAYEIGNGEHIAAVRPWEPPTPFGDLSMGDCVAALTQIHAGTPAGHNYAATKQARDDWAGHVLMDMFGKTEGQATTILSAWVASGALVEGMHPGPRRGHDRKAYTVDLAVLSEMKQQTHAFDQPVAPAADPTRNPTQTRRKGPASGPVSN